MRLHAWLYSIACATLLPLLGSADHSNVSATSQNTPSSIRRATGTCSARSINYITHGLPQQCLETARESSVTSVVSITSPVVVGVATGSRSSSFFSSSSSSPSLSQLEVKSVVNEIQTAIKDASSTVSQIIRSLSSDAVETSSSVSPVASPSVEISASLKASISAVASNFIEVKTSSSTSTSTETTISAIVSSFTEARISTTHSILSSFVPSTVGTGAEADSPLEDVKFLSFEEWKRQNLAQAGQSAEELAEGRRSGAPGHHRTTPDHSNGHDVLGEDSEFDIDFSGFGGAAKLDHAQQDSSTTSSQDKAAAQTAASSLRPRSKDAGKTGKERFNYASFDCAANVLKTNPRCKSSSSILVENKDSYMLNECSMDNKFIIVELCDDILIDTIVLANFEFFSSMFRTFRVSVSDRFPVKLEKWKELGVFEARNSRDIQAFWVENPLIWARYLRIEFLKHYGSEFYCPLSLLRVHGTTMMEEYRREERAGGGDADDDDDMLEQNEISSHEVKPLVTATTSLEKVNEPPRSTFDDMQSSVVLPSSSNSGQSLPVLSTSTPLTSSTSDAKISQTSDIGAYSTDPIPDTASTLSSSAVEPSKSGPAHLNIIDNTKLTGEMDSSSKSSAISSISRTQSNSEPSPSSSTASMKSGQTPSSMLSNQVQLPQSSSVSSTTSAISTGSKVSVTPVASTSSSSSWSTPTPQPPSSPSSPPQQQQQQHPGTQESIFKSIHKRLTSLESNSSLSLAYIESQSQLLLSTLNSLSKHQQSRIASFLDHLNISISAELTAFKRDYDQLWQSTVLELAEQREEGHRERELLGERVRILAEEMVGQKRIMAAQATALLVCAALLIFTRIGPNATPSALGNGSNLVQKTVGAGINAARNVSDGSSSTKRSLGMVVSPVSPASPRRRWKWDHSIWPRSPPASPPTSIQQLHERPGEDLRSPPGLPRLQSVVTDFKSEGEDELEEEVDAEAEAEAEAEDINQFDQPRPNRNHVRKGILGVTADRTNHHDALISSLEDLDHDPTPTDIRPSTAPGIVESTTDHFADDSGIYPSPSITSSRSPSPSSSPSPQVNPSGRTSTDPSASASTSESPASPALSTKSDIDSNAEEGRDLYDDDDDDDNDEVPADGRATTMTMTTATAMSRPGVTSVQSAPDVPVLSGGVVDFL